MDNDEKKLELIPVSQYISEQEIMLKRLDNEMRGSRFDFRILTVLLTNIFGAPIKTNPTKRKEAYDIHGGFCNPSLKNITNCKKVIEKDITDMWPDDGFFPNAVLDQLKTQKTERGNQDER